jgi:phosphoserine phosphatase
MLAWFAKSLHTFFSLSATSSASKVTVAEAWAEREGIDLATSWFYSDSITDLPMLERVGHARVVRPDSRLARSARKRGWPILDWNSPAGQEVSRSA